MRVRVLGMLLSLVGCGRFGFGTVADVDADADADAPIDPDMGMLDVDARLERYHATAVRFETAANDYIWTGSLDNTTNSGRGIYSAWFHFNGGDDQQQMLMVAQVLGVRGGVARGANNRFQFLMQNCSAFPLVNMESENTYTSASGWVHLLASWDVALGRADLYVNDVVDRAANPTVNNGNICYAALRWGVGGLTSSQADTDVADVYMALGTYRDLDVEANRRLFRDAAGKPVDLGVNCTGPLGVVPTGCFIRDPGTWNTNKGTGAGFTLEGDGLAVAPTSPSD